MIYVGLVEEMGEDSKSWSKGGEKRGADVEAPSLLGAVLRHNKHFLGVLD